MTAPAIQSSTAPSSLGLISDDVVAEILLRLPPAYVLRCGAVCRAWRAISTSPGFEAAYARRRPLELIVQRHGFNGVLDTIPAGHPRRGKPPVHRPRLPRAQVQDHRPTRAPLQADGLLRRALAVRGRQLLRHRPLGLQPGDPAVDGLRAAAQRQADADLRPLPPRAVGRAPAPVPHQRRRLRRHGRHVGVALCPLPRSRRDPAAATVHMFSQIITEHLEYHGRLHWLDHPEAMETGKILAFDTVSETFRRISRPPSMDRHGTPSLLEMDGKVAMAAVLEGRLHMDLWVLEDYYGDDESWAHRHRIDLPPAFSRTRWAMNASVLGRSSNVILLGDNASGSLGLYDLVENRVVKQVQLCY
ncbi:unnamed protein product [Urochloa decumbens]|uniref:F-box domain-containing protein n=1 Tax=Urochloa decumbens TaxID=240449 RepID=A0ABC8VRG4_9POAL